MGRQAIIISLLSMGLLSTIQAAHDYNEFKRMPDLRGQSFGLENFLLQPFNMASQAEDNSPGPKRREPQPPSAPFNLQYQVQNDDFDVRKLLSRTPPHHFTSNEHQQDLIKPVHEFSEPLNPPPPPPPQRRRQPNGESNGPQKRRMPPQEVRRPLEKPSEFQLSLIENEPFIPQPDEVRPERQRKRVMKRRRKKPTTPQPEIHEQNEFLNQDELPKLESTLVNIFGSGGGGEDVDTPTSYQHTMKDSSIVIPETITEHKNPRRRLQPPKRQKDPSLESLYSSIAQDEDALQYEDKLESQASQRVPQRELPLNNDFDDRKPEYNSVTETQQEPTQKLKSLLKQQNGQLSLSELLQTQNLSLSDFLKGNPGALSALGANKVTENTPQNMEKEVEKLKADHKPHIPKISSKSRPFSKQNTTKIQRKPTTTTTTEETLQELPKKLQITEVTSDKPTYNGFAPKNPRRGSQKSENRPGYSKEKSDESNDSKASMFDSNKEIDKDTTVEESKTREEKTDNESLEVLKTTTKSPTYRLTTVGQQKESTISEHRVVPKRYGDYRGKLRIDRRKPTVDVTTEGVTIPDAQEDKEDIVKIGSSTEEIKISKESKNRVRIPFMSVNNPEISLILPNKKPNVTTERPKERTSPVIKDRINLFKRLSSEEKQISENTVEVRESMSIETSTLTIPISSSTRKLDTTEGTIDNVDIDGTESSDEIVELLKTGNNAQRLHRILAARNMTVTELLEKRANSSKQPNVTHLFEKKIDTGFTSNHKITELSDNHHPSTEKQITTKKILPVFTDLIKTDNLDKNKIKPIINKGHETNNFDELFVDESMVRPIKLPFDKDENREPKAFDKEAVKDNIKNPMHRVHLNLSPGADGKAKHPMPLWNVDEKSIYNSNPYGYPTYDLNKNLAGYRTTTTTTETHPIQTTEREAILLETVNRNLDSNHRLKTNINDILKEQVEQVEVIKENNEDRTFIPPAVKSAIIASGVVMGIALIVFVAIFAACGWKQRQFRLRARSSILNDSLNGSGRKTIRRTGTLSPVSFKRSSLYKKSIDFEDTESSVSSSSNTSSYLWNTLKHTFQSRNSTLKNRQEKEEKIQERESRSRRNTLSRDDERVRRNTISRDDQRRDSVMTREADLPRRNTLSRDDLRRDSVMSRDTLSRDQTRDSVISRDTLTRDLTREDSRRSNCYRDDNRRLSSLLRENERCSFKKIDPERSIIQTSVNFKRGGFNNSSRHFDSCDHFN